MQEFLGKNAELLRDAGYDYRAIVPGHIIDKPKERHDFAYMGNGAHLGLCMLPENNSSHITGAEAEFIWSCLERYLETATSKNLIISSEWFFAAEIAGLRRLKLVADQLGYEVRILAWIRPQWEYFFSAVLQNIKVGNSQSESFQEHLPEFIREGSEGHYIDVLTRYEEVFSRDSMIINVYDKKQFIGNTIFSTLAASLQTTFDNGKYWFPEKLTNATPSVPAANFLLQSNRSLSSPHFGAFFSDVAAAQEKHKKSGQLAYTKAIVDTIRSHFEKENDILFERYFGGENVFGFDGINWPEQNKVLTASDKQALLLSLIASLESELVSLSHKLDEHEYRLQELIPKDPDLPYPAAKIVRGEGNHLFLGGEDRNQILEQLKGLLSLSHNDVVVWGWNLSARRRHSKENGYKLLNVICPEPHVYDSGFLASGSIVSENRPALLLSRLFPSELVYLLDGIKDNLSLSHSAYIATDSHWSAVGAYAGYLAVMKEFGLQESALQVDELLFEPKVVEGDLGIKVKPAMQSATLDVLIKEPKSKLLYINNLRNHGHIKHYCNSNAKGRLLIFGTSFSTDWIPFFAESFGELLYLYSTTTDCFLIDHYKPDYVLYELPERFCRSPQSDRSGLPFYYSCVTKHPDHVQLDNANALGISKLLYEVQSAVCSDEVDRLSTPLPNLTEIRKFLSLNENHEAMLRDTREFEEWTAALYDAVDNQKINSYGLQQLPRTSVVSLALVRAYLKEGKMDEAAESLEEHFGCYGYTKDVEWYLSYLGKKITKGL